MCINDCVVEFVNLVIIEDGTYLIIDVKITHSLVVVFLLWCEGVGIRHGAGLVVLG